MMVRRSEQVGHNSSIDTPTIVGPLSLAGAGAVTPVVHRSQVPYKVSHKVINLLILSYSVRKEKS